MFKEDYVLSFDNKEVIQKINFWIKTKKCLDELEEFYKEIVSKKYENNALVKRSMELSFRSLFKKRYTNNIVIILASLKIL